MIGATFPEEGRKLRALMPRALILVPGYGAQGGSAASAAACFNDNGLGAVVSSSRGTTYSYSVSGHQPRSLHADRSREHAPNDRGYPKSYFSSCTGTVNDTVFITPLRMN